MINRVSSLIEILGTEGVIAGEQLPEAWLQKLPGVFEDPETRPCLALPQTIAEMAEVVTWAARSRWGIIPAGRGLQLNWGKPIASPVQSRSGIGFPPIVLSTDRLQRVIDHAVGDLTLTAEAGLSLGEVEHLLRPQGQFLALEGTAGVDTSLGGLIATADAGSLRHRYGGVRDQVLGIEWIRADGQLAKAGGRVVKNVAGYDLMKLFTGSYGSLGILTQATFRLYPLPDRWGTIVLQGDGESLSHLTQMLAASALTPVALDGLSRMLVQEIARGNSAHTLGLALQFASLDAAVTAQLEQVYAWAKAAHISAEILEGEAQTQFWQRLQQRCSDRPESQNPESQNPDRIFCKIGVLPSHALETLDALDQFSHPATGTIAKGLIHLGSGLGWVELEPPTLRSPVVKQLRDYCEARGGFLTLLTGSVFLKKQVEVWGYRGNALPLMANLKQTFDPQGLFNPNRFVV